jgi:uncharacterized protein (DUF2147 family)
MPVKLACVCFLITVFTVFDTYGQAEKAQARICGKWESTERNLRIQVYMQNNQFKANIIWFKDTEGKPMDYWTDVHNPDPALRNRKILGMSVLSGLKYDPDKNTWEDGMVYDSKHGRDWNASANIDKNGILKVRGYWHFKFIGRTMDFVRIP